jgi:integrase
MKIKLTQKVIDRELLCPEGKKQIEFCDTELPGMYVLVSSTSPGIGTYYLRYKNDAGTTKHRKIGRTTDINLKEARDRAKLLKLEISQGRDPQADIKKRRNEMSYSEFMEDYYFPYIEPRRRSAGSYREMYDLRIKAALADTRVNNLRKQQIQAFHSGLRDQGLSNAYCNRHLQLIKSSINVGINVMEVIDIKNPAVGIPLLPEESKERYLDPGELSRLMPVLMNDDGQIAKIIRFLLATGLRLGECLNCEWSHIDIDNKVMTISSAMSKSKKTASIPLNAAAIQVLGECDREFDHPFANHKTELPFVTPKKGFQKLMKQAGLEGVTAHTLRHTAASIMINAGRSLYDVQKVLRHSSSTVTEKYSHLSPQSVMAASDTISDQLMRAASGNR